MEDQGHTKKLKGIIPEFSKIYSWFNQIGCILEKEEISWKDVVEGKSAISENYLIIWIYEDWMNKLYYPNNIIF